MKNKETDEEKKSFFQEIIGHIAGILKNFWEWLKTNPADHWSLQILKSLGKLPLVLLLIICSPVLLVVLLIVFLIAI